VPTSAAFAADDSQGKATAEVQRFLDERVAVLRRVRESLADAQDVQKAYADAKGRRNKLSYNVGDAVLLSTCNLPNQVVSCLPGGGSKLLPRYIGPFKVVRRVGELNYQLDLPTATSLLRGAPQEVRRPHD
jgi:hypothetical protein